MLSYLLVCLLFATVYNTINYPKYQQLFSLVEVLHDIHQNFMLSHTSPTLQYLAERVRLLMSHTYSLLTLKRTDVTKMFFSCGWMALNPCPNTQCLPIRPFTVPTIPSGKYRLAENLHYICTKFFMDLWDYTCQTSIEQCIL